MGVDGPAARIRKDRRSSLRRRSLFAAAAATTLVATMTVTTGEAAQAAPPNPPPCRGLGVATSIDGTTRNHTKFALKRTYIEKGVINFFEPEPALQIAPKDSNNWCALAFAFGTAIKVNYSLPDGTVVRFAAERYLTGIGDSSCSVVGPSAGDITCSTELLSRRNTRISANFSVFDRGQ